MRRKTVGPRGYQRGALEAPAAARRPLTVSTVIAPSVAGCISVSANVAPGLCAQFQAACLRGDWAQALALQDRLFLLHTALFTDASPGPVKYALSRVRKDFPKALRLPMTPASSAAVDAALAALEKIPS